MTNKLLHWNKKYETSFSKIDDAHLKVTKIINRFFVKNVTILHKRHKDKEGIALELLSFLEN